MIFREILVGTVPAKRVTRSISRANHPKPGEENGGS
jgi:hypothetical protein